MQKSQILKYVILENSKISSTKKSDVPSSSTHQPTISDFRPIMLNLPTYLKSDVINGRSLMKNALNNQVGMLGNMFLWLVANLKQGVIYFIKQEGGNHKIAWVYIKVITFEPGNIFELTWYSEWPLTDSFSP